jgi:hypothetical protein
MIHLSTCVDKDENIITVEKYTMSASCHHGRKNQYYVTVPQEHTTDMLLSCAERVTNMGQVLLLQYSPSSPKPPTTTPKLLSTTASPKPNN